ncbi:MAG: gamma-glutamyltransferase family protein [Spirochaetaceae bacterium]|nr:MAG: gamma-glutamyltransferase family protein [Spirochaetaceae bacterium]
MKLTKFAAVIAAFSIIGVGVVGAAGVAESDEAAGAIAVTSAHQLATQAGIDILEAGGTAADAAFTVAAVLTVVEPWFSSVLGGGTWALHFDAASGSVESLDGVGPIGSLATPEDYAQRGGDAGMHQAVVPGAWGGWMAWLEKHGVMDLPDLLEPAIRHAREGYQVGATMASWMSRNSELIAANPASRAMYMPNGSLAQAGDTVKLEDLARTFDALAAAYDENASNGRAEGFRAADDYFYRGPLAEAIVAQSDAEDGYLTLEDFTSFHSDGFVEPLSIRYRDMDVYQNPPNSQGITMLIALNILNQFDLSGKDFGDADATHLQIEAIKLAFAARHYHVGDPAYIDVPVQQLLSAAYAEEAAAAIRMDYAQTWPIPDLIGRLPDDAHTTTYHVVDSAGNAAAVTTSLGAQFHVIGDTGIHINNRMRMTGVEADDPNRIEPGKKVRHTSNPYMALRDGVPVILGGNTGADIQPQGQVQQFISVVEFGQSPQEAVSNPRFVVQTFPAGRFPYDVQNNLVMEQGFSEQLIDDLSSRGHTISVGGGFGSANMIVVNPESGTIVTGSDPRMSDSHGIVKK